MPENEPLLRGSFFLSAIILGHRAKEIENDIRKAFICYRQYV